MSKIKKITNKEERKDNLNEPLVVIEQDSFLTKKRVITYLFNKEKKESVFLKKLLKIQIKQGLENIIFQKKKKLLKVLLIK
jgi:hypothetical protein